jgi:hypothetical protein
VDDVESRTEKHVTKTVGFFLLPSILLFIVVLQILMKMMQNLLEMMITMDMVVCLAMKMKRILKIMM